jgi:hypothetical protein
MDTALVVYESLFGNARTVAEAIARGVSERCPAQAVEAGDAPRLLGPGIVLLVVGGPNHRLGMPRPTSRAQAARQYALPHGEAGLGLREWLAEVERTGGVPAAAFDTRLDHPGFLRRLDRAARTEERLLRRRGCMLLAPSEHFLVTDVAGPLRPGEEDRALAWGRSLGALIP